MTAPARGILQLDLTQPVKDLGPSQDGHDVPVVLRAGPLALGQLVVPAAELPMPSARLRELAATTVAAAVGQHLLGAHFDPPLPERRPSRPRPAAPRSYGTVPSRPLSALARTHVAAVAAEPTGTPAFSVIICTRNRPQQLVGALAAVARLDPAQAEVVVVDNTPRDGRTGQVVDTSPGVRYVCEPVPGLSVARNAGVRASTGELLAFTDDDARPSPGWIAHLATAFADPQVGVVTGLLLPEALDSEGARVFERPAGFGQGFRGRDHDLRFFDGMRRRGVPVWRLGAGADMAARRRVLALVGPFDERLGAGASGCSEDSELWCRVLAAGFSCRYAPAAEVAHQHREDLSAVRRQARDYMRGHVTALSVQFAQHRQLGELRRAAGHLPLYLAVRLLRVAVRPRQPFSDGPRGTPRSPP